MACASQDLGPCPALYPDGQGKSPQRGHLPKPRTRHRAPALGRGQTDIGAGSRHSDTQTGPCFPSPEPTWGCPPHLPRHQTAETQGALV